MIFSDEEYSGMSCVNDASIERNEKDPHTSCTGILLWVSDETRTRDSQDHNLVLYQLNYTHHQLIMSAASGSKLILAKIVV